MSSHRMTARGTLLLVLAFLTLASVAGAAAPPAKIVFPVLGPTTYVDDFGDPRAGGPHQGIDMLAAKRSLALAAEAGKVEFWTRSATAGCMLYLHGQSGTDYDYIHLNNDLTAKNDNRGKCVRGVAYTVKNGARVQPGQQIAYVGDSGDADGGHAHLHFEVHPGGGKAVSPYPYLQKAYKLLFAAKPGTPFSLTLTGTVVSADADQLTVNVATSQAWPTALTLTKLNRPITLTVPPTTLVQTLTPTLRTVASVTLATRGQKVVVWTQPAPATLKSQRADDGALTAALIQLG
jgi:hypothetical protein